MPDPWNVQEPFGGVDNSISLAVGHTVSEIQVSKKFLGRYL